MRRRGGGRGFGGRGIGRRGFGGRRGGFGRGPLNRGLRGLMNVGRGDFEKNEQTSGSTVSEITGEDLIAQIKNLSIGETEEISNITKEDLAVIDKLADLLYKGFITQAEYDAKKKQVLGL